MVDIDVLVEEHRLIEGLADRKSSAPQRINKAWTPL